MNRKTNDRWLRFAGIPLFAFLAAVLFYSDSWIKNENSFFTVLLITLSNTLIYWEINKYVMNRMRTVYPAPGQTIIRVSRQLLLSTAISILICIMITWIQDYFGVWKRAVYWQDYVYNILVVLVFVYTATGIHETAYFFSKWKQTLTETEQLKKANLQSQFDSLKNQVNPHFLFNSLNTLASLIEEDQLTAVDYVNRLARVYRYLLQSNDRELTSLRDELDFLEAYFFLQKIRFGEGIKLITDIPDRYMSYLIPPLTLQILLENAVKHNVVSVTRPLTITIEMTGDFKLSVRNNYQKKTVAVASNGMGLANIAAKYKLLNQPEVSINNDEHWFTVQIPLILQ